MIWRFLICVLCAVLLIGMFEGCIPDDDDEPPPKPDDQPTGGWNGSPEDPVVRQLADEFKEMQQLEELRIAFSDGPIDDFINITLKDILEKYNHVDFIGVTAKNIDPLIETGWIQPYPKDIDEDAFLPEAIEAMKRDNTLYGIPLFFTEDGQVKGVTVSSRVEKKILEIVLQFNDFLSEPKNSQKLAEAAGGKSARK